MANHAFTGRVYDLVAAIPAGRVMTYGGVAAELGLPRCAREVGWALARCHEEADVVPCHRVILSTGRLSAGFGGGHPEIQRDLLEAEGVVFEDGGGLDLAAYLWWPAPPDVGIVPYVPR